MRLVRRGRYGKEGGTYGEAMRIQFDYALPKSSECWECPLYYDTISCEHPKKYSDNDDFNEPYGNRPQKCIEENGR